MIGSTLGQYKLLDEIGRGGMGVVYLSEHVDLGTRYALKVLPEELSGSPSFVRRFKDEARVMARLDHPAIVKVVNLGAEGTASVKRYYLVMELVVSPDGAPKDLQTLVDERGGRLHPEHVLDVVQQVCRALDYAHAYSDDAVTDGVVHRDLKPANILIGPDGRFKISDFGLTKMVGGEFILSKVHGSAARSVDERSTGERPTHAAGEASIGARPTRAIHQRTATESILGTYDYMSPEQRDPARASTIDRRSDIYSLGVLIYRLLTGHKPEGRFELPSSADPGVPVMWDRVVDRCLQPWPDRRYRSCSEIIVEITSLQAGGPGRVPPVQARPGQPQPVRLDERSGYMDGSGQTVIAQRYEWARGFSEGLAAVKLDGSYGYIDTSGTLVIAPRFDWAKGFSEGLAAVKVEDAYGYIDTTGALVIAPQFDDAREFHAGLAPVEINGKWGYIDRAGRFVIGLHFDAAWSFYDGLACVATEGKIGYIDTEGRYVWAPTA